MLNNGATYVTSIFSAQWLFCTALGLPLEMLKQKVKKTIGHLIVGAGEGKGRPFGAGEGKGRPFGLSGGWLMLELE